MNISKNKKNAFLSHVPRTKNLVPRSKDVLCSPRTDGQTDRQTHTKVTTEGTLSGFQEFFLQPIIKDRPNTPLLVRQVINRNPIPNLFNHQDYPQEKGAI